MDSVTLLSVSRQVSMRRAMEVIANNLANMNTTAFKAEHVIFQESARPIIRDGTIPDRLTFALEYGTSRDFAEGQFSPTSNDFDLAISGRGFFVVQTPDGQQYTRNGHLSLSPDGRLVTRDGYAVLDADGREIVLPDTAKGLTVSADGTVDVGGGADPVRIAVVTLDNPGQLEKVGGSRYRSDATSKPAKTFSIMQGMIENSNVSPILEMTRMIEVTRAYQTATNTEQTTDDLSRKAIDRLGRVQA